MGVTADMLTATGLISATATAVSVATGHLHLAIVLLILTGLHDLLDGPVAKASGTSSVRGAFFDSVTDRVSDALILGGVAWYLVSNHPGHLVLLPFAVLGATSLVSYQRAKAESLGISAKGGLMERAERMILLGIGLITTSFLVPVLWVMLREGVAPGRATGARGHATASAPHPYQHPCRGEEVVDDAVPVAGTPPGRAGQPVRTDLARQAGAAGSPAAHQPASHLSRTAREFIGDEGS
jgi:CDP-diacylglycerol--glycerol-3-phosphate 3-phosphatidyltransferase